MPAQLLVTLQVFTVCTELGFRFQLNVLKGECYYHESRGGLYTYLIQNSVKLSKCLIGIIKGVSSRPEGGERAYVTPQTA